MARLGKLPILVPAKVNVDLQETNIKVKGTKGELVLELSPLVNVRQSEDKISVVPANPSKKAQQFQGANPGGRICKCVQSHPPLGEHCSKARSLEASCMLLRPTSEMKPNNYFHALR